MYHVLQATLKSHVVAESDGHSAESAGYHYFPSSAYCMDWLRKTEKTRTPDRACPHGVQFYDVVIDGEQYPRAAWSYVACHNSRCSRSMADLEFWEDVKVA